MVRGGGERNPGSPPVDDVGVGKDIGDSHRGDQPRGRGGADEEGREAIATGMPGAEGARRGRERSRVGDFTPCMTKIVVSWLAKNYSLEIVCN